MSVHNGTDGAVLAVTKYFLDENDQPIKARPGYPMVRLRDADKTLLSSVVASPTQNPGEWSANVSVPNMGLLDKTELRLVWIFRTVADEKIQETDAVILEPKVDNRVSDIVATFGDQKFGLVLPQFLADNDTARWQLFANNVPMLSQPADLNDAAYQKTTTVDRSHFMLPLIVPQAALQANLLMVKITPAGSFQEKTLTFKVWAITPQIALAMSFLNDFLDKSHIAQVIPELRYNDGDLITYLERGLNLFNMVQQPSYFNGTNMQGVIFDAWVTCASYYALGSQLLAEGSLAFDFSGQGVSLNVDRTPQLESALGRIEGAINDRVVPLKKYLAKQGVMSGDGSIGSKNMNNPSNMGILEITNSPTTRVHGMTGFTGRRGWGW
jgi:hypothetical protein